MKGEIRAGTASQSAASPRWPDYKRVRELMAVYRGEGIPRATGTPPRVAVVGAGLAGLVAAHLLTRGGCRPLVFDASETTGGRIRTDRTQLSPGMVTELGGEFIDTAHADMIALARTFGCTPIDTEARSESALASVIRIDGQLYARSEVDEAFLPFAGRIRKDAASLSRNVSRKHHSEIDSRFDRLSIDEYLRQIGLDGWLRARICSGYTTLNGLDSGEQSAINLLLQIGTSPDDGFSLFGKSDERWKTVEGLDQIVSKLASSLETPVAQGHRLARIRRENQSLNLEFTRVGGTVSCVADAVVLALPFTLLRQVDLPRVFSDQKMAAIRDLAYGTNSKVLVATRRRIWRDLGSSGDVITNGMLQCGWDGSRQRAGDQGVFTYFLGGAQGLNVGESSVESQAGRLNSEASAIWPGFNETLAGPALRVHWPSEPWALASYSTYRPGQRTSLSGDEAMPEAGIYFAGEHCSAGWQGYMQGAASTGREAALAILRRSS